MRAGAASAAALLIVLVCITLQASTTEDIYWEGEEDASNEYLEVKENDNSISSHLERIKRDLWSPFSFFSSPSTEGTGSEVETATEDRIDDENPEEDEKAEIEGSGLGRVEPEIRPEQEKTLRVTFVVMEPYHTNYSNRDSVQFQNFSKSLAESVNQVFEKLPGTQRATLVRIQSQVDDFTCKVTLDIVTTGYYDTDRIKDTLRNYISQTRNFSGVAVSDTDFNAMVVDPATIDECAEGQLRCEDGICLSETARCNGVRDCDDGSDEAYCPPPTPAAQCSSNMLDCEDGTCVAGSLCDGVQDCPNGLDEANCTPDDNFWNNRNQETGTSPSTDTEDIFQQRREDPVEYIPETTTTASSSYVGCSDPLYCRNSTQQICPEQICDGPRDCPEGEDEWNCTVTTERPVTTGCAPGELRCDDTRCVPSDKRCDNVRDCQDGKDEENCVGDEYCGVGDFRCNDGTCIEEFRRCNRISDCTGEEDEKDCKCQGDDIRCESDGTCIEGWKRCDGINHCRDSSDELNCAAGYFRCATGKLIPDYLRCDRRYDCPQGDYSDEQNCQAKPCPPGAFTCFPGSSLPCAVLCDGVSECDEGEDEKDCDNIDRPVCDHECDNKCLEARQICDTIPDCSDGSDESNCYNCDGPEDFRCNNGECIHRNQFCNGQPDCEDESDESDCNAITEGPETCNENQFQCNDGTCINNHFKCDGHEDCIDGSDEVNCGCPESYYQCRSGQCVPRWEDCEENRVDTTTYNPSSIFWPTPAPIPAPTPPPPPPPTTMGPSGTVSLMLKIYDLDQVVRYGGDVVFRCRDEGVHHARVKWIREGGAPLKPGATDVRGRLEMNNVTVSDSGVYVCEAIDYIGTPGSRMQVTLKVEPSTKSTVVARPPMMPSCDPYRESTCHSGHCIAKSLVCNGVKDCSDGSDEDNCGHGGLCEPNHFKCSNGRCVLKTWVCDGEDDCRDSSDEENCGVSVPGELCLPFEFTCNSRSQCIPKSYRCDGQSDCLDFSDEIGCAPVHATKPPYPANLKLKPGDTLTLTCTAVGVPTPLITWRLNWGKVPPQCVQESEDGVGTLVCTNMQSTDSGAYSCEALNNRGTIFAVPDSIVFVEKIDVCPNGYFNSEARVESECIKCFCFGESTQCKSADLFTYNMPTPLGEGGTRLVGIQTTYNGDAVLNATQSITEQYYYTPQRNAATVTKLARTRSSNAHPFLALPESYNGNQLTSYGGYIKYRSTPHSRRIEYQTVPDIIIKGKYQSLLHFNNRDKSRDTFIEARLTPDNWKKSGPRGLESVTREDIMMALDQVEMILLRADFNDAGVDITDFVMESAHNINMGLGAASLVEECTCPQGYEGLSCQKCAPGYVREQSGAWLGHCVPVDRPCPAGNYRAPGTGACLPCPCPLTNRENQFARTCNIAPDGDIVCDCAPGYEGRKCERCASGYVGNPMVPGDSCRIPPAKTCNPIGTRYSPLPGECVCKDNVQGPYCDQCQNKTFYLSEDFKYGCALCFCSGMTEDCTSSNWRRKTTVVPFNNPSVVSQLQIFKSTSDGSKYKVPLKTPIQPEFIDNTIVVRNPDPTEGTIYYWSLPPTFAGNILTAYGGYLTYSLHHTYPSGRNDAPEIQLITANGPTYHYYGTSERNSEGYSNTSVKLLEKGWQRPDGEDVSREMFLLALADIQSILIKATQTRGWPSNLVTLVSAGIDKATPDGTGAMALHVEQCSCPAGYRGTSCENCAPGYKRGAGGIYLRLCEPCDCNGHSNVCHPETGICSECRDNTDGSNCEECRRGFERDAYGNCIPSSEDTCRCNPDGEAQCVSGVCQCKANVEGLYCDRCRAGTFGLDRDNTDGCLPCYCNGATTDCNEGNNYYRIQIPAPIFGGDYGGYTIMDLDASEIVNDQFVPVTNESEIMYMFSGEPRKQLYWSLPVLPGNRVLSYGGNLSFKQKFETGGYPASSTPGVDVVLVGEHVSIYWSNPVPLRSGEAKSFQVPLKEGSWRILNEAGEVTRYTMMAMLSNLKRVLVRATLSYDITSTAIADVSMDTATTMTTFGAPIAKGIEVCACPEGHLGTSCETCEPGFYADVQGYCRRCNCNGHQCQLSPYNEVECNCAPPYTGRDCSTTGDNNPYETTPPPSPPTVVVRITSPTIKIQAVGTSVTFSCEAISRFSSNRLPVQWIKDNGQLPQGRTQIDRESGVLLISNLQMSDSGKYICQTSDGVNTAQASASLFVNNTGNDMSRPTVSIYPPVQEYYEGDRVTLQCDSTGNPAPTISWQRTSSRPLPLNTEYSGPYLIIANAQVQDSGEYRCVASNTAGSTAAVAVVTIRSQQPTPSRDKLTVSPTSSNVLEGQSTHIVCTGTTNIPPGSIGWIRQDGVSLQSNVRSVNGVLYIDIARLENEGVYVCQTAYGVPPIPVLLKVEALSTPAPGEASNISVSLPQLKIPSGQSGRIECTPRGYPLPTIKWTKHQGDFGSGTSQRDNTLIITNAQENDQGYYLCEGSVDGTPIANEYVFVEIEKRERPLVEIWPRDEQYAPIGGQFEFQCRITAGIPDPVMMWSRDRGLPLSRHTQILPNNILRFENIDVNDEGVYTCSATNEAGSSNANAILKVRSPPEITIRGGNDIRAVRGSPLNVECRANGYPEPVVSIKSKTEFRELVPPTLGIAVLRIPSVTDRDDGEYTCVANSTAGSTEDQFLIRVDRGDADFPDEGSGEDEFYPPLQPKNLVAIEGTDTRFTCNGSGYYDIVWSRANRTPLQGNARQQGSELVIYRTSKSDAGQYECTLIDRNTGAVLSALYTTLVVKAAPRITLRPATQTVHPGQSPTVECIVEGDDILQITWRPLNVVMSSRVETRESLLIFHNIEVEDAGEYECFARNRITNATAVAEVIVSGPRDKPAALVNIDQPRRQYRVGDNVEVLCRTRERHVTASWERHGTREYVQSNTFGGGAMLIVQGVQKSDEGTYRCTGTDRYGRTSYDDFQLEVQPGSTNNFIPYGDKITQYEAQLSDSVDLPCNNDLEPPVSFEWKKEYSQLSPAIRTNEQILRLEDVTEADAGTYVCRVSNNRAALEARAVLRVIGVLPQFDGEAWLSLPTLADSYTQFHIEISFRPADGDGLILYNSQEDAREGDYIALVLNRGVPEFIVETGTGPITVRGDRPLKLNTWHTIRLNRNKSRVTMDVDNTGPFIEETSGQYDILDLHQPLYIGKVPDNSKLPYSLDRVSGFIGCVSMLILGREEKNIMIDSINKYNVKVCDVCSPNQCLNKGVCQEASNERGYMCLCAVGFAGLNCDRTGEACRPGLCGPGKCTDTTDGYKCSCPVTFTGKHCDVQQVIEYPAFTGSAYLAIRAPETSRAFRMSMKIKPTSPLTDGVIMYCAESPHGHGGFTSLALREGRLEFRYDLDDGTGPVVLTRNKPLQPNEWTNVNIARVGQVVSLKVNLVENIEGKLNSPKKILKLETPMFVGGVDDSIVLNNYTGVSGGFYGCIKDVKVYDDHVDIVNSSIQSANVSECSNTESRGDIPESDGVSVCSSCRNGGFCRTRDDTSCTCPSAFTGQLCEIPVRNTGRPTNPCAGEPCRNGGTCAPSDTYKRYTCTCVVGFLGDNCDAQLHFSVAFTGNGYLELPSRLLRYDNLFEDSAVIALAVHTSGDGVLVYQTDTSDPYGGDFIMLRVEDSVVVFEWNMGDGPKSLTVDSVSVTDGERHKVIARIEGDGHVSLSVDDNSRSSLVDGFATQLNVDTNIYIGGIPDSLNVNRYRGVSGCFEQVELMDRGRGIDLGREAVSQRNVQRCKEDVRPGY